MTLESRVAKHVFEATADSVGSSAMHTAHASLIDIVGVTLAGSRDPSVRLLADMEAGWGGSPGGQCRVLGRGGTVQAPSAALANGAASRVLDFDDVVDALGTHPSVTIFPPLLAVAELLPRPVSGRSTSFRPGYGTGQTTVWVVNTTAWPEPCRGPLPSRCWAHSQPGAARPRDAPGTGTPVNALVPFPPAARRQPLSGAERQSVTTVRSSPW